MDYRRQHHQLFPLLLLPALMLIISVVCQSVESSNKLVVNVKYYGARGDGSDATEAFTSAWKVACSSKAPAVLEVPGPHTYLLKPIVFSGPCKSTIIVNMRGTMVASPKQSDWNGTDRRHWILFKGIKNLHVHGGGSINGNGHIWWKNSCKINKSLPCRVAPTAITFYLCNTLDVNNLRIEDGQQMHVSFEGCSDVRVSRLTIAAPGRSPNTDGIHVANTKNIKIASCTIGTGDDCISIVSGSQSVKATNIVCGPGHGISIGSLGAGHSKEYVSGVVVDTAKLSGTRNGVRIKTWQGGRGYATNIVFRNIDMNDVDNPIIIDQNYCDSTSPCQKQGSAVRVKDVLYENIKGTSATSVAIRFDCSRNAPCTGIVLRDINLTGGGGGGSTRSVCSNVELAKSGTVVPSPCT